MLKYVWNIAFETLKARFEHVETYLKHFEAYLKNDETGLRFVSVDTKAVSFFADEAAKWKAALGEDEFELTLPGAKKKQN